MSATSDTPVAEHEARVAVASHVCIRIVESLSESNDAPVSSSRRESIERSSREATETVFSEMTSAELERVCSVAPRVHKAFSASATMLNASAITTSDIDFFDLITMRVLDLVEHDDADVRAAIELA